MDATKQVKSFIKSVYDKTFSAEYNNALTSKKSIKPDEAERIAQKEAIKTSILRSMKKFPKIEPAAIWRGIYEIHVHRKSGIADASTIEKVIAADQSWKKSSGHAFEEMVKLLANAALDGSGIEILLQRDLNTIIKADELANEPRDISWLKEQIKGSVFDLYATYVDGGKRFCFGCIQSKTSIRDRVTRDREPSITAMRSFFWSVVLVLDGDFLKLPKFKAMVEGGTTEYKDNGWHGMYVFSDKFKGNRIYPLHVDFSLFAAHASKAAQYWRTQRQWFNADWKAE